MSDNDRWIEITIVTSHEAVEAVSAILYDAGVGGVAIEDPKDIIESNTNPNDWDYLDERLLPEDTGEAKVKGYLMYNDNIDEIVETIRKSVGRLEEYGLAKGLGEVSLKEIKEQDWANSWKEYYKPFKIGNNIVIKPSWENYTQEANDIIIELDPGMAFGTGTHETTWMCIELLEEYIKNNCVVFDIGCGSGILSIVSSKLGASKVIGVDIDEIAVKASRENVSISKVENVEIKSGNLLDVIRGRSDIIVANIIADVIIKICKSIPQFLQPGGVFICSGIINSKLEEVKVALQSNGFTILKIKEMGEWAAVVATIGE